MISIVDVGCRYGVYSLFSDTYENFYYIAVDTDIEEINRLKLKYKNSNIRFFSRFLGESQGAVQFNFSNHKGYGSSKVINEDSIWFGLMRPDETDIAERAEVSCERSAVFLSENVDGNSIVKLDIEGGELDFLRGLDDESFGTIEAFIIESHFDSPYKTDSNLYSIGQLLFNKGYWAASVEIEGGQLNKYYEPGDAIPIVSNVIFLKNIYKPTNFGFEAAQLATMVEVLYALKLEGLLLDLLSAAPPSFIREHKLCNEIKFMIGHKLNRLVKKPFFTKKEIEDIFAKIFGEKFPIISDFYESNFFNP